MRVVDIINHMKKQTFLLMLEHVLLFMVGLVLGLVVGLVLVLEMVEGLGQVLEMVQGLGQVVVRKQKKGSVEYIRQFAKLVPEDWFAEIEALRHKWRKKGRPKLWIRFMTYIYILDMLKARIQIEVENALLLKNRRSSKNHRSSKN